MIYHRRILLICVVGLLLLGGTLARADEADSHLVRGTYHWLNQGDLDSAEQDFMNALSVDPRNADAAYFLGRVYYQRALQSTVLDEWIGLSKAYLQLAEQNGIVYDGFRVNILPRLQASFAHIPPVDLTTRKAEVTLLTEDQRPLDGFVLRNQGRASALKQDEPFELDAGQVYSVESRRKRAIIKWLVAVPVTLAVTGLWLSQ